VYDFIHSLSRNKLQPARADKLVYVFSNLRVLASAVSGTYQDAKVEWQFLEEDQANEQSDEDSEQPSRLKAFVTLIINNGHVPKRCKTRT
jgi:hypothetical protein